MTRERERFESIARAQKCGLTYDDAVALRRIALTLHRWFELECGDSNDYVSWCISRGRKVDGVFANDDSGKPYLEKHIHKGQPRVHYIPLPDRETGARKRLDKLMAKYPQWRAYIQGDCRGGTIYLCKPEDATDSLYTRGVFIA
jgi:hypothetical protein